MTRFVTSLPSSIYKAEDLYRDWQRLNRRRGWRSGSKRRSDLLSSAEMRLL